MEELFKDSFEIFDKLEQNGFEAFFVGGSVRDMLMQRPIGDIDIATSAKPDKIMSLFPKTIDVGAQHGTVVVLLGKVPYEVTTYRHENEYQDYRHPKEVLFISSLEEDLKRRDFTMNAIAMSKTGEILDPFHGQKDIENGIIQTVGNPNERFLEDALRMMRAIRFVSQLSFTLSEDTFRAVVQNGHLLVNISVERIAIEFKKLLAGQNSQRALKLLCETKLFRFLPGLENKKESLEKFSDMLNLSMLTDEEEYWTLLLFQIDETENVTTFLKKWKLPNKIIKNVEKNLQYLTDKVISNTEVWSPTKLYQVGIYHAIQIENVYRVLKNQNPEKFSQKLMSLYEALPIKSQADLSIDGHDLIKWTGKRGGPWLKSCIMQIEILVLQGQLQNNKEAIKEWLAVCNQN